MIEFTIGVAGRTARVRAMFETTKVYCADYPGAETADFEVELSPADIAAEREISARTDALEGCAPRRFSDGYLEMLALQRKLAERLFGFDTLLFHGSAIAVDGEGYLFTAKSGTGKSTHTRLWREAFGARAEMINDDKPFLKIGGGVTAYGSPWNGKHRLGGNTSAPLKAICILERGERNEIVPVTAAQALPMLLQQSHRPADRSNFPKYMDLIDRLTGGVRFYRLKCNMEPEAALVAFEGMKGKNL